MAKRTLGIIAGCFVALALVAAGCGSPSDQPATEGTTATTTPAGALTAQEIASSSVSAYNKLDTVKMNMDMTMDMETTGGSQPMTMHMAADAAGPMKVAAKEMQLTMNIDMDISAVGKQQASVDMYMVGGWVYEKVSAPGIAAQWLKIQLTDEMWAQESQLGQQIEFLKSAIEVASLGTESVGGIDCYVLDIKPNMNALSDWVKGEVSQQQSGPNFGQANLADMFKSFTIKEWVSKKDFWVVKADMAMSIAMSGADLGADAAAAGNMTMNMTATVTYSDFNKPVSIVLPPEAASATALPGAR